MFIEMVFCVAVDFKRDSRKGRPNISKGRKFETAMAYKNKT